MIGRLNPVSEIFGQKAPDLGCRDHDAAEDRHAQ
jgi:hypothetical protein